MVKIRRDSEKEGSAISRISEKSYSNSLFTFIGVEYPKFKTFYRDEVEKLFPLVKNIQYPDAVSYPEVLEYFIQKSKSLKGTP
jgi:hypothetical protein